MLKRCRTVFVGIATMLLAITVLALGGCSEAFHFWGFGSLFSGEEHSYYTNDVADYGSESVYVTTAIFPKVIPQNAEIVAFSYYNYYNEEEDAYLELRFASAEEMNAYLAGRMAEAEEYLSQYHLSTDESFLMVQNPHNTAYTDLVCYFVHTSAADESYTGYWVEKTESTSWLRAICGIISYSEEELTVIHTYMRGSYSKDINHHTPKYLLRFEVSLNATLDRRYWLPE